MPVKYIGAIAIFASCGAFGFLKAAYCRREAQMMGELVRLLEQMQSELAYRLTPLPQICAFAAEETSGSLRAVFSALATELDGQIAPDAATCMQVALSSAKDLSENVRKCLTLLGNSLGKFDLQGQMDALSAVKEFCVCRLTHMRENQEVRLRSYRTLGLCVGAGLAILFL
jgi:stage III sporulation protein AB